MKSIIPIALIVTFSSFSSTLLAKEIPSNGGPNTPVVGADTPSPPDAIVGPASHTGADDQIPRSPQNLPKKNETPQNLHAPNNTLPTNKTPPPTPSTPAIAAPTAPTPPTP